MTEKSPKPGKKVEMDRPTVTARESTVKYAVDSAGGRGAETRATLYEVGIAGVPLRLKSSHDEQTVNELVSLVDHKIREALPLTKTGAVQNAAILAALHLAEDLLMLKRKAQIELDRLEAKTLKVISEMENSRSGLVSGTRTDVSPNGESSEIAARPVEL